MLTAQEILKQYFGYAEFRPLQADIIQRVLNRQDCLVLMPTGGGKSICYQVPALMLEGLCVVVSPLISLMKDQVEALKANKIPAAFLNSSLDINEQQSIEAKARQEQLKILYVSPEKAVSTSFLSLMRSLKISLIAIDEAHCVSTWGHDFRPEYQQLSRLQQAAPQAPMIALTATADKVTRKDILQQLALREPKVFLASFNRENIRLNVAPAHQRVRNIITFLQDYPRQAGIIYCISRKNTESLAEKLQAVGIDAQAYHAGMSTEARNQVQEAFLKEDLRIVCATIAFGMGIDKPNVRFVIHYNLPQNLESYYQEIGRAGRDSLPSQAILFYTISDLMTWRDIIQKSTSDSHQRDLRLAKLERIQQFAEAQICRRRILLSYFNENLEQDCGNCDVCQSPRPSFDGTILAQKALSAAVRLKESVGINMLINVLRGSANQELISKGYDRIKTYGAGADVSFQDWKYYLQQMVNMGALELAYDQNYALKRGVIANDILFNNKRIELAHPVKESFHEIGRTKRKTKAEELAEELFMELRKLRKTIADREKIRPYSIFNDDTLTTFAQERPLSRQAFESISGVTAMKAQRYAEAFLLEIRHFVRQKAESGEKIKHGSHLLSEGLFQKGYPIERIAAERNLNIGTIAGHLIWANTQGLDINLESLLPRSSLLVLLEYFRGNDTEKPLQEVYEDLEEAYEKHEIKIAEAIFRRKK